MNCRRLLIAAVSCVATAAQAAPPSPGDASLWESEGNALRELVAVSSGADKGEALFRLGEWERESARRVRVDVENNTIPVAISDPVITHHLDAARDAYSQAKGLASTERLPQVLFALGDLLRSRNDPAAAGPLRELVENHPEHPLAVDAAIALGDDAFDAGNLADAVRRFEFAAKAARSPGARAYANYKLAWCDLNLNDFTRARGLLHDVIRASSDSKGSIALADEGRRDLVLTLARDPQITATAAEDEIRALNLDPDRTRHYVEGYARIIAGSGRDAEAVAVLGHIEHGAAPADARQIFTAELEIAVRNRDLGREQRAAARLSRVVSAFPQAGDDSDDAERALRVAAVTVHGEGRARADDGILHCAARLYDDYFLAFDGSPASYELHHHAGELFARLQDPVISERHYSEAVRDDLKRIEAGAKPGKWLDSSAEGAIAEAQATLPQATPPPRAGKGAAAKPSATALVPAETTFVAACDRYLKALPAGREVVDVRYQRALVLYRHNLLDVAEPELSAIAIQYPTSDAAQYAAELAMDALQRLERYDELAALTARMREVPALRARLGDELETTQEEAVLAAAAQENRAQHYTAAARRYADFVKRYPHSDQVDRALYNGAAALAADGRIADSIALRQHLLSDVPDSALIARARDRQLAELLMLGRFADGARLAAQLADEAHGADCVTRLHDAIALADVAGEVGLADRLRESYVKRHRNGPDAMSYALALAQHARSCDAAAKAYGAALVMAPDSAWRAITLTELARRELRCHKTIEASIHANEAAAAVAKIGKQRADALDASADAALIAAEPAIDEYHKTPLSEPYERTLPRKLTLLKKLDARLAQVVSRGRATPAVCALVASGQAYADIARELDSAHAPRRFNADQRELFHEQLTEKSQPLFDRAKTALTDAITKARDAGVSPPCLRQAVQTLATLWPERFGKQEEAVAKLVSALPHRSVDAAAILARAPDAPPAWLIAARSELSNGQPRAAILLAGRIEESDHLYPQALEVKALALDALGESDAALTSWQKLARDYPERPLARRVLVDRAMATRDFEGAKEQLLSLRETDARDPAVALNLGVVLRGLGDVQGAEKSFRAAAQLAPKLPEPSLDLGLLLCGDGARPAEGVAALEQFQKEGGRPPDSRGLEAAMAACRALAQEAHK